MMERIWIWIARANARLVFIGALIGLIAAGGWQVWNELNPEQTILIQAPPHTGDTAPSRLPLLDFVAERQRRASPKDANPFATTTALVATRPPRPPRPTDPSPSDDGTTPATVPPTTPTPTTPVDPPRPPTPTPTPTPSTPPVAVTPPPVTRTLRLRYNGLMIRPDGVTVAWIANSETGASRFHAIGEDMDGLSIEEVTREHVTIVIGDDAKVPIARGSSAEFNKRGENGDWEHIPEADAAP